MVKTKGGIRVTRTQLKGAWNRYLKGKATLVDLERAMGVFGHHGKFLRRAWQIEFGHQPDAIRFKG